MLQFNIPIVFGVLTTNNLKQVKDRVSKKNHKGIEAAEATIAMIRLVSKIKG